jgi:hypothetical protein
VLKAGASWKPFYREHYGIDVKDVGLFRELAARMRGRDLPAALSELFEQIRAIALAEPTTRRATASS